MLSLVSSQCRLAAARGGIASMGSISTIGVHGCFVSAAIQASGPTTTDQQVRYRSNRSRRGLYDGKDIRSGNSLSFSMKANKRKFKPNVFKKRVYSEVLDEMIRFHLTASTLRSIDKAGGLDIYLLTSKHVTEGEGLAAKQRIVKAMKFAEKKAKKEAETGQLLETTISSQNME